VRFSSLAVGLALAAGALLPTAPASAAPPQAAPALLPQAYVAPAEDVKLKRVEGLAFQLTWDPGDYPEVVCVYRKDAGKKVFKLRASLSWASAFTDKKIKKGKRYGYYVTVAHFGNIPCESQVAGVDAQVRRIAKKVVIPMVAATGVAVKGISLNLLGKESLNAKAVVPKGTKVKDATLTYEYDASALKVTKKGVVSVKKLGVFPVKVVAHNGVSKTVNVKVKNFALATSFAASDSKATRHPAELTTAVSWLSLHRKDCNSKTYSGCYNITLDENGAVKADGPVDVSPVAAELKTVLEDLAALDAGESPSPDGYPAAINVGRAAITLSQVVGYNNQHYGQLEQSTVYSYSGKNPPYTYMNQGWDCVPWSSTNTKLADHWYFNVYNR
jgi:hypothetical protein